MMLLLFRFFLNRYRRVIGILLPGFILHMRKDNALILLLIYHLIIGVVVFAVGYHRRVSGDEGYWSGQWTVDIVDATPADTVQDEYRHPFGFAHNKGDVSFSMYRRASALTVESKYLLLRDCLNHSSTFSQETHGYPVLGFAYIYDNIRHSLHENVDYVKFFFFGWQFENERTTFRVPTKRKGRVDGLGILVDKRDGLCTGSGSDDVICSLLSNYVVSSVELASDAISSLCRKDIASLDSFLSDSICLWNITLSPSRSSLNWEIEHLQYSGTVSNSADSCRSQFQSQSQSSPRKRNESFVLKNLKTEVDRVWAHCLVYCIIFWISCFVEFFWSGLHYQRLLRDPSARDGFWFLYWQCFSDMSMFALHFVGFCYFLPVSLWICILLMFSMFLLGLTLIAKLEVAQWIWRVAYKDELNSRTMLLCNIPFLMATMAIIFGYFTSISLMLKFWSVIVVSVWLWRPPFVYPGILNVDDATLLPVARIVFTRSLSIVLITVLRFVAPWYFFVVEDNLLGLEPDPFFFKLLVAYACVQVALMIFILAYSRSFLRLAFWEIYSPLGERAKCSICSLPIYPLTTADKDHPNRRHRFRRRSVVNTAGKMSLDDFLAPRMARLNLSRNQAALDERVMRLPCGHVFHEWCVLTDMYKYGSGRCPSCRSFLMWI